jgi:hypothetical protein
MIDYQTIRQLAKEQGLHISDLCALAPQNDPFYVGQKAQIKGAQWFADLWKKLGFKSGAHLRRIHYTVVSQNPPINKPNGKPYLNTESDWDYLASVSKWARYLGLVSPYAFVDRRNPEAIINARFNQRSDPTPGFLIKGGWDDQAIELPLPTLPDLPQSLPDLPSFLVTGYQGIEQNYLVEIWVEKTTMNDVLAPLCKRYGVNLITGAGELSITAVMDFLKRASQANRPARILYISDFDPAGLGMPISVARKIEFAQRDGENNGRGSDLDIRLHPIALTDTQVKKYRLPRVPVKDTDKRKDHFEAAYGEGAVELDALEALHPGALAGVAEEAILKYYDPALQERAMKVRESLQRTLTGERAKILAHQPEMNELRESWQSLLDDYAKTQAEFAALVRNFQPQIEAYRERLEQIHEHGRAVYDRLRKRLETVDVDLGQYALPAPDLPRESKHLLYDSTREYLKQLAAYKARRNGIAA